MAKNPEVFMNCELSNQLSQMLSLIVVLQRSPNFCVHSENMRVLVHHLMSLLQDSLVENTCHEVLSGAVSLTLKGEAKNVFKMLLRRQFSSGASG